ncbi:putative disease resistance protein At3g14460 [Musa acuminata AAA Group]|uniref:putative disease resistance protein At3g14460 n=1 Tax=Musa acuminata AAA Group TaxID=214697 RepID=UPI0031DE03AF
MAASILSSIAATASRLTARLRSSSLASSSSPSSPRLTVHEDLKHLQRTLLRIQSVLTDAEVREIREESVKLWLRELKALAYDADDVLDEYNYELLRPQIEVKVGASTTGKRKRDEGSDSTAVLAGLADRIKRIRERFDEIAREREALHLKEEDGERRQATVSKPLPTSSLVDDSSVYGRQVDRKKLVNLLLSERGGDKVSVLAIVGMGGIGKTTLAQYVYNHHKVCTHFDIRVWIYVSVDFDVISITRTIIKFITGSSCDDSELDLLHSTLTKLLNKKRFLLVLDDVWNELPSPWESLSFPMAYASSTKIMITTQNESVARVMQTMPPYYLGALDDYSCQLLFDRYAFKDKAPGLPNTRMTLEGIGRQTGLSNARTTLERIGRQTSLLNTRTTLEGIGRQTRLPNTRMTLEGIGRQTGLPNTRTTLEGIGRQIVRKCNGLPLAAKTLGSLLSFEDDEEKWQDILESELWGLFDEGRNEIFAALRLSYYRMPTHLKQCFVYFSLFPKGYLFEKDHIVKLWMAQGYIQPRRRSRLEDVGGSYFDELLQRQFFQISKLSDAKDENYVMHDVIHDLAKSIAGEDYIITEDHKLSDISEDVLHATLIPNSNDKKVHNIRTERHTTVQFQFLNEPKRLRTFVVHKSKQWFPSKRNMLEQTQNIICIEMPNDVFQSLRLFRTLDLSFTMIEKLPDSIGNLIHLRYIGLRSTNLRHLPQSLCQLYNLQTLDLKHCEFLSDLPRGIGNLINLRHLILPILEDLHVCIPPGLRKLTNLQTLPIFYIKPDRFHCGVEELKELVNLSSLHIVGPYKMDEEWGPWLKNMKNLQNVRLRWFSYDCGPCGYSDGTNLENGDKMLHSEIGLKQDDSWHRIGAEKHEAACFVENQRRMSLMELVVEGYNGPRLPRWLGDPSFSKLATIRLELCNDKCILLPSLGQLVSLKHLSIGGMQRLQRVDREFWGGGMMVGKGFQALETLEFTEMPEWEEWCGEDGEFPHLRELTIGVCPKLFMFDCLLFPSLVELKIYNCGELTSIPICPSLSSLLLWGKCNLEIWFPSLNLPKLHHLVVSSSQGLRTLHVRQNVPALRTLCVDNCPKLLEATGLHHLSSLVSLQISNCPQFYIKEKLPSHVQVLLYPSEQMQRRSISVSRLLGMKLFKQEIIGMHRNMVLLL